MSLRKSGALRYGFIAAAAVAAFNQSLDVEPLIVHLSLPEATLTTPGTSAHIPYQRPVAQRTIRFYGPPQPVATGDTGATLSTTPLVVTVSLPTVTAQAGGVSVAVTPLVATASLPTASVSAGPTTVAVSPLVAAASLPEATLQAAGGGTGGVPVVYQRPVFQRGIRAWGPPAPSTTPELDRTLTVEPLRIAVSLPEASAVTAGDARLPASFLRIRTVRARPLQRPSLSAVYGVIEDVLEDQSLAVSPLTVAVSLPAATITRVGGATPPEFARTRQVVRSTVQYPRTAKATGPRIAAPPVGITAGSPSSLPVSPLTIAVSLPPATLTAGTASLSVTPLVATVSLPTVAISTSVQVSPLTVAVSLPTATATGGAVSITLTPLVATVSLPTAQSVAGAVSLATSPLQATVSLPTVTVDTGTVRVVTPLVIMASLPPATASAGAVTLPVSPLTVAVSLPTATLQASITRTTTPLGVAVSLPTATLTVGASTVQTTPLVATASLPPVTVLGAITLPATIFDTTLESRLADRTLESPLDNTIEVTG